MLRRTPSRRTFVLSAALLAAACLPAFARPAPGRPAFAQSAVEVDVIDRDNGQWLPEYRHRGDTWIAGAPGHRYSVRLTNTSGERVLVVLSVDGVNAVTGEDAHPSQAGYVLAPWQSTEVAGWRKSLDDVAQFVFTDLPDSYAARTGRPHAGTQALDSRVAASRAGSSRLRNMVVLPWRTGRRTRGPDQRGCVVDAVAGSPEEHGNGTVDLPVAPARSLR